MDETFRDYMKQELNTLCKQCNTYHFTNETIKFCDQCMKCHNIFNLKYCTFHKYCHNSFETQICKSCGECHNIKIFKKCKFCKKCHRIGMRTYNCKKCNECHEGSEDSGQMVYIESLNKCIDMNVYDKPCLKCKKFYLKDTVSHCNYCKTCTSIDFSHCQKCNKCFDQKVHNYTKC
jgi:hypothetical protein